jgi:hypothetical protein
MRQEMRPIGDVNRREREAVRLAPGATGMTAALCWGFFREMWNAAMLAKWIYTVPGVERGRWFEMPAAGYAGHLPFRLECLLVIERLRPDPPGDGRAGRAGFPAGVSADRGLSGPRGRVRP